MKAILQPMTDPKTMEYLVLSEATLLRLLWRTALNRPTCVISTRSLWGGLSGRLERLVDVLKARGRVSRILDLRPDLEAYTDYGDIMRLADPFVEAEPWFDNYFHLDTADDMYGRYGIAYRHNCCNAIFQRFATAFLVHGVCQDPDASNAHIAGLDALDLSYYHDRFKQPVSLPVIKQPRIDGWINAFQSLAVAVYSALWIVRKTRIVPPPPEEVFLGSDYVGGGHDIHLWQEIADENHTVVVVCRSKAMIREYAKNLTGYRHCCVDDGWHTPGTALCSLLDIVGDGLRIFRHGRALPSDFFRGLCVLPHKRCVYRALFNRFHFRNFWGRDDYNSEHIIRSQELRERGGVSFGIMHGISSICVIAHQNRHIDFDIYYMFGRDLYDRVYRQTWPSHMKIRDIGSFGMAREEFERLKNPRPNNILCICSPSFHQDQILEAIETIARALPDRKVFINVKGDKYLVGSFGEAINRLMERAPDNLVIDKRRSYELLLQCQYMVNESSTLTAEAIQFGLCSFILDTDARFKNNYYRHFPGICVRTATETVERIRAIEDGSWDYPRHQMGGLINMTGYIPWDEIRKDMGLAPRRAEPLSHLAFVPEETSEPTL